MAEEGKHCAICLNLNGCCFVKDKAPTQPQHPNCHCYYQDISIIKATAICPIEKFTKYAFVHKEVNDKSGFFKQWGYTIEDSEYLKNEYEQQAKQKYELGEYVLKNLSERGQIINITIELNSKIDNRIITVKTGWMVYHDGILINTTPYTGR